MQGGFHGNTMFQIQELIIWFRCADTDKSATDGVTVAQAGDFFDLTVGSIINSILVGKRFEEHNKDDFLKIKEAMGAAFEVFSPFDMAVPVWFLRTFFRSRYDMMMTTQNTAKRFAAAEAVKR